MSLTTNHHKRSACDRCKGQKLRCVRAAATSGNDACVRCLRAGAACVTSQARPVGRPRALEREESSYTSSATRSRDDEGSGFFMLPDGCFDDTWTAFLAESEIDSQFVSGNDCITSPTTLSLPQYDAPATSRPETICQIFLRHDVKANTTIRLSQLNESLARQIAFFPPLSRDFSSDLHVCIQEVNEADKNPVVPALQSATEFTSIVEELISSMRRKDPASATNNSHSTDILQPGPTTSSWLAAESSTSSDGPYTAGTPITLLLVSSYLQIVELFNFIFVFSTQILQSSSSMAGILQFSPDVCISGLPPMKALLYIKIMIQMAEHYLHRIQGLLCLPEEMLLSSKESAGLRLFDTVNLFDLLKLNIPQRSSLSMRVNLETLKTLLPA
ncbi:hypothetical protein PV08_01539 [Exophiala spinifera]|uniref:Zn(2)-C6 fungal-type domain-containing protein n=1 Tax=Exophiala spinifera TaxID=91928 RepID=A0A0D2BRA9_9EURO|nr:uncharacterized protein PV08_01539 [Exophiala spinifera]KIW20960.1 hypothetical protein PV08_01539 [Exophiala spinifera]